MKLTIVIYHKKNDTTSMLDSLINQITDDVSIIAIDDAAGCKVLDKYKSDNIIVKHNKKSIGKLSSFQMALRKVTEGYVCLFDAEDKVTPDFIEKVTEVNTDDIQFITYGFEYLNWHKYKFNGSNVPVKAFFNTIFDCSIVKNSKEISCFDNLRAQCNSGRIISDIIYKHKRG